jgi:hypothetical protein
MASRHTLRDGREVVIRTAAESDAAGLLENINLVGAEEVYVLTEHVAEDLESERAWIRQFDGVHAVLYVADARGEIVGQADAHRGTLPKNRHTATLGIAIRDGWRDAGLGRLLLAAVLDWMRSQGVEKACLEVFSTNARALALYRSLGFEEEGRRRRHFKVRGEYVDDVQMALWL